jgi:hypothetical protein
MRPEASTRVVRGRGVDGAGAGVGGDVGGQHAEDFALEERMLEGRAIKLASLEACHFQCIVEIAGRQRICGQCLGHNVDVAIGGLKSDVVEVGMERDGHRCRQGPRGGRPDDGVHVLRDERKVKQAWIARHLVAHIHRRAGVHFVLNFRLGQRGAVVDAPVNRLQSAIDEALLQKSVEGLKRPRFVIASHRFIRVVPAAEDAEPLELRGLQVDVLLRVLATGVEECGRRQLQFLAAQLLVNLDLDGQAVAVEAGDVGRVEAGHGL